MAKKRINVDEKGEVIFINVYKCLQWLAKLFYKWIHRS